jgi:hypothetical protein
VEWHFCLFRRSAADNDEEKAGSVERAMSSGGIDLIEEVVKDEENEEACCGR